MLAIGDDGCRGRIVADGTILLILHIQTESFLEETAVPVVNCDDVLVFKELQKVIDAFFAESPVVTAAMRLETRMRWSLIRKLTFVASAKGAPEHPGTGPPFLHSHVLDVPPACLSPPTFPAVSR